MEEFRREPYLDLNDLGAGKSLREAQAEIQSLKRALAESRENVEALVRRSSQMQRFFAMRPEEMRRVGQAELMEIIDREQQVARLEKSLKTRQAEVEKELEIEYQRKSSELEERKTQQEKHLTERAKRFDEHCAAQRSRFDLDAKNLRTEAEKESRALMERSIEQSRAAIERKWADEKTLLQRELDEWRAKTQEASIQFLEERNRTAELEGALWQAEQAAAQEARLTETARQSFSHRLKGWEDRAAELDSLREELKARQERCSSLELSLGRERDNFARKRKELDDLKERFRAEMAEAAQRQQQHWKDSSGGDHARTE